jgi:hypothetical protein
VFLRVDMLIRANGSPFRLPSLYGTTGSSSPDRGLDSKSVCARDDSRLFSHPGRELGGARLGLVGVWDSELFQEAGQPTLVQDAGGNRKHRVVEALIGIGDDPAVDIEKDEGRR